MRALILWLIVLTGTSSWAQESVSSAGMTRPEGMVISDGILYVADSGSRQIWYQTKDSTKFAVFVSDPQFEKPTGLAADETSLYVADPEAGNIFRIDKRSKAVVPILTDDRNVRPEDLTYLPVYSANASQQLVRNDQLMFLDGTSKKILQVDIADSGQAPKPWDSRAFELPVSLSRENHHLLVTDQGAKTIFESEGKSVWANIQQASTLAVPLSSGVFFPELSQPRSVVSAGDLYYVLDHDNLFAIVQGGTRVVPLTYRRDPLKDPRQVIADLGRQRLLISDPGKGAVISWPLLVPVTVEVQAGTDTSAPLSALYSYLWRLGVLPTVGLSLPYSYGQGESCLTISCVVERGRSLLPQSNSTIESVLCQANEQYCVNGKLSRARPGDQLQVPWVPYEKYLSVERLTLDGTTTVRSMLSKWIPDTVLRQRATEAYLQTLNPGVSSDILDVGLKGLQLNLPIQRNRYYLSVPRSELLNSTSDLAEIVRRYTELSIRSEGTGALEGGKGSIQAAQAVPSAASLAKSYDLVLKNMDFEVANQNKYGSGSDVPILVGEVRADCNHPVFFRNGADRAFDSTKCEQPEGALDGIVIDWTENVDTHGTCVSSLIGARSTPYGEALAGGTALTLSGTTNIDSTTIAGAYASFKGSFIVNLSRGNREVTAGAAWRNLLSNPLNKWVLFVAAAGNDDDLLVNREEYPAVLARDYPNLISVGALDESGRYIWEDSADGNKEGSNTGDKVEILAPGQSVPCAMEALGSMAVYTKANGTSLATPLVSAVAALLLSKNLTPGEIKARILSTAEPLDMEKDGEPLSLFGKLSVKRALLNPKVLHITFNKDLSETEIEGDLSDRSAAIRYQIPGDLLGHSEPVNAEDILSIRRQGKDAAGSYLYRLVRFDAASKRVELNNKVHLSGCLSFTQKGNTQDYVVMLGAGCSPPASIPQEHWITEMTDFIGARLGPDRFDQSH